MYTLTSGKLIKSTFFIRFVLAIALLNFGYEAKAQVRCVTTEVENQRRELYKSLPSREQFEQWMANKMVERRNKLVPFRTSEAGEPDKIAVVVHVIYNEGDVYGEGTNITDEQIFSQIEVLNEDYQRKNADTIDTQPEFLSVASNLNLEFVLARQTKVGDPTTGIMRVQGTKSSYNPLSISDRELLSSLSHWDPNIYLNVWVTNLQSPYIGLGQFPDYTLPGLEDETNKDNEATDGMVIDFRAFGSAAKVPGLDLMPLYNLGRTSTHEIGHFLSLKHVWGDGGCTVDDYVDDTPNSDSDYSGLCIPSDHLSCGTNDMFENFLYYTNDDCMNIFTQGQVDRMNIILENAPRRNSLLNSTGTSYPDDLYFDLAIQSIISPGKVECDGSFSPVIEVRNNGTIPVVDFDLDYSINSIIQTYTYTGDTIFSAEVVELFLEESTIQNGDYKLLVELNNIPDDIDGSNDRMELVFAVDDQTDFIPLREQFESLDVASTNWITINEDDDIGWEITTAPNYYDENTAMYMNLYNYEVKQELDWLISPSLDFSSAVEASVAFKTSYARNATFNDQLRVVASTDCGNNFNDILMVLNSDDLSIMDSENFWEPIDQNDWTEHIIDLEQYVGETSVRLAFVTVNDYGNNLYLDDIEFFTTSKDNIVETARNSFIIYPNPTNNGLVKLTFNTSERQDVEVSIIDQMGRIVTDMIFPNTLNQTYYYDFSTYRSGVYFIHSKGKDFIRSKRLVISR